MKIDFREVGGQTLRVGIRPGDKSQAPLLLFNGIGANIELVEPFLDILDGPEAIVFDVPGVGGSPPPRVPYRPWHLVRLSARLLDQLGHNRVDVLGVSWGGAIAQQFAFQQANRCRRLVLAATSPGHIMVPGKLAVHLKMASPRRYWDPAFMGRIAGDIYGGRMRNSPELVQKHMRHVRWSSDYGYYLQLMAFVGWTSLPWLPFLPQPTLVMAGSDDPIVPLVNGRIMAKLIPDSQMVTLDDGHLFLLTSAQESARLITEFLGKNSSDTRLATVSTPC